MSANVNAEAIGVYVSVPFCRAKCSFCNFASGVSSASTIEQYVASLCEEIDGVNAYAKSLGAEFPRAVDTLYFGGGTPSLLAPEQLKVVFSALHRNFDLLPNAEMTLEAAPGQIADDVLQAAMQLGINRVSLGVQSFVDRESVAVGRSHTRESCLQEFERLQRAGLRDVGADLIAGLPHQTEESWSESLRVACESSLTHLSVYMFEVDEDSRLGQEVMTGGLRLHAPRVPADEMVATMYERACERLTATGFVQYEISNFAKPGFQSRHNRKYWERAPYVGFGLDAHSMLRRGAGAVRFGNPDELVNYSGARSLRGVTAVDERAAFEENVFLGLRLLSGVNVTELKELFPREWVADVSKSARELAREELMVVDDSQWRLTLRGRLLSSEVFGELLAGVAA